MPDNNRSTPDSLPDFSPETPDRGGKESGRKSPEKKTGIAVTGTENTSRADLPTPEGAMDFPDNSGENNLVAAGALSADEALDKAGALKAKEMLQNAHKSSTPAHDIEESAERWHKNRKNLEIK